MYSLKTSLRLLFTVILFCILCVCTSAQQEPVTRSITSDDFSSQRPASKTLKRKNQRQKTPIRRATYKYVSQNKKVVRRQSPRPRPKNELKNEPRAEKVSEVGVTMWKLRPPRSSDNGYKLPVQVNNSRQMWIAERVDTKSVFQSGDRIRLAIESSVSGYLYVINSELFADGGIGDPYLIFPASENEDNSVGPGLLVDIPDQTEDLPYFLINPKNSNYKGERLTVIISPKPLSILKADKDGRIKNLDDLMDFENNTNTEIYSRNDSQDKIYSQTEAESACGAKNRQLTREKSAGKPCGEKTRQLTREEPLPQTIYRLKTAAGQPAVAFIELNVTQ